MLAMHGRKRETPASRLERRTKSLPKVKLLQKLHKEIVRIPNSLSFAGEKEVNDGVEDGRALSSSPSQTTAKEDNEEVTTNVETMMLSLTKKLLEIQPEMVTCWNKRKASFCRRVSESVALEDVINNVAKEELNVSEQGLRRNPKSYCAWEHRRWVIDCLYHRIFSCTQSSSRKGNDDDDDDETELSSSSSVLLRRMKDIVLREREMLETLLNADDRNFHAWNYRRFLIDTISRYHFSDDYRRNKEEEVGVIKRRTREEETKYAREKISKNFSNYSAWHHRSVHFEQFDEGRDDEEGTENPSSSSSKLSLQFQAVLNAEFELVSQAFFTEPEDQSAWMYHRWLLSQLDEYSSSSSSSKKAYKIQTLQRELHRIRDVSEMEPTCKWPALVCARLHARLAKETRDADDPAVATTHVVQAKELFERLIVLDPLRKGYYADVLGRL